MPRSVPRSLLNSGLALGMAGSTAPGADPVGGAVPVVMPVNHAVIIELSRMREGMVERETGVMNAGIP